MRVLLQEPLKGKFITFLQENSDIFTWTTTDTPKIDPELIRHKLDIDPDRDTVKQIKMNFNLDMQETMKQNLIHKDDIPKVPLHTSFVLLCYLVVVAFVLRMQVPHTKG